MTSESYPQGYVAARSDRATQQSGFFSSLIILRSMLYSVSSAVLAGRNRARRFGAGPFHREIPQQRLPVPAAPAPGDLPHPDHPPPPPEPQRLDLAVDERREHVDGVVDRLEHGTLRTA